MTWDYLIVGAGFEGAMLAEQLASQLGATCLVIDQRDHIGGDAFDKTDDAGVLIHPYGPHYFRMNSTRIVASLSQLMEWQPVDYKILSWTEGRFWHSRSIFRVAEGAVNARKVMSFTSRSINMDFFRSDYA